MKIKTLSYSESRESCSPIGLKSWQKIGIEVELESDEIAEEELVNLKKFVGESFTPTQSEETLPLYPIKVEKSTEQEVVDGTIKAIQSAQNKKTVEWHKAAVERYEKKFPEIGVAYRNQLQKFA